MRAFAAMLFMGVLPVVVLMFSGTLGVQSIVKLMAAGLVAAVAAVVIVTHPRYGVYFMVFYVYAGLGSVVGSGLVPFAVMLLIVAGVALKMAGGEPIRLTDPLFLGSLAFFGIVAVQSMLWAHDLKSAALSYSKFLKVVALVFLVVQTIRTPQHVKWFARALFVGAVATVILGLAARSLGMTPPTEAGIGMKIRFSGLHVNANYAAAVMTTAIPIGVFVTKTSRSLLWRLFTGVGILLLTIAIFATYSRQAVFALAFVILAVLFKEVRSRGVYGGIIAVLFIGVMLTPRYYWDRLLTIGQVMENAQQDWSIYLRVIALKRAVSMFMEHPFLGVGLRNFSARSGDVLFVRIPAHNMYLEILTGVGLVGFAGYMTIFYSGIRQCLAGIKYRWRSAETWMREYAFYTLISLLSALISGPFINIEFQYITWIPVAGGLVIAALRSNAVARSSPAPEENT
jgi:O-antigen ligase